MQFAYCTWLKTYLEDKYVESSWGTIVWISWCTKVVGRIQRVRKEKQIPAKTCVPFSELLNLGNFYAFSLWIQALDKSTGNFSATESLIYHYCKCHNLGSIYWMRIFGLSLFYYFYFVWFWCFLSPPNLLMYLFVIWCFFEFLAVNLPFSWTSEIILLFMQQPSLQDSFSPDPLTDLCVLPAHCSSCLSVSYYSCSCFKCLLILTVHFLQCC
jgi:hypothetical protein